MRKLIISKNESGQRIDRFLKKYLNKAPNSFIFKMLRKKNIELNKKRAKPETMLKEGDIVYLFLAEDTINKFRDVKSFESNIDINLVYEDKNIILINKDIGISSHSSYEGEDNLVDGMISYLIEKGDYNPEKEKTFIPSIVNRLDKNTSGIVIGCKNYQSLKAMNEAMRDDKIDRYYISLVSGDLKDKLVLEDYLLKDKDRNKVEILEEETENSKEIKTKVRKIESNGKYSLVEVQLLTGRSHQIRAHLASIGNPLVGDPKYGERQVNSYFYKNYKLESQFLHSNKVKFTDMPKPLEYLSGKEFTCELGNSLKNIVENEL